MVDLYITKDAYTTEKAKYDTFVKDLKRGFLPPNSPFPEGMYVKDKTDLDTLRQSPSSANLRVLATADLAGRVLASRGGLASPGYIALIKEDFTVINKANVSSTTTKTMAQGKQVLRASQQPSTPSVQRPFKLSKSEETALRELQALKNELPLLSMSLKESEGKLQNACKTLDAISEKMQKLDTAYQKIKGFFSGWSKFWNCVSRNSLAKDAAALRANIEKSFSASFAAWTRYINRASELAFSSVPSREKTVGREAQDLLVNVKKQNPQFIKTVINTLTSLIKSMKIEIYDPKPVSDTKEAYYSKLSQRKTAFESQKARIENSLKDIRASSTRSSPKPRSPTSLRSSNPSSPTSTTNSDRSSGVFSSDTTSLPPSPRSDDDNPHLYA